MINIDLYFVMKEKRMNKNDYSGMGDVGIRFLLFRKAIKKTRSQLSRELSVDFSTVKHIEESRTFPRIKYLHYLNREYGLDINWMLCGRGDMFTGKPPQIFDLNYVPGSCKLTLEEREEFMRLMQIPVIEQTILEWLEEYKQRLRNEG